MNSSPPSVSMARLLSTVASSGTSNVPPGSSPRERASSFEQALSGSDYFVALNYQLTRRLSIIARAGSTNALDLVYSLAFD